MCNFLKVLDPSWRLFLISGATQLPQSLGCYLICSIIYLHTFLILSDWNLTSTPLYPAYTKFWLLNHDIYGKGVVWLLVWQGSIWMEIVLIFSTDSYPICFFCWSGVLFDRIFSSWISLLCTRLGTYSDRISKLINGVSDTWSWTFLVVYWVTFPR